MLSIFKPKQVLKRLSARTEAGHFLELTRINADTVILELQQGAKHYYGTVDKKLQAQIAEFMADS